ncbi:MAG TPA: PD-(D/E)XK nuclease family protein [Thiobacillaceae bacterium]|nr:PD-(D/E)XK nuclease family protein [Thiobacillaceae bacterium]
MNSAPYPSDGQSFDAAAAFLLAAEGSRLPDLRACTVLVPHFHAAGPFLAALRGRIEMAVFLPPRMLTLPALAAGQAAEAEPEADALRLAQVQSVLARTGLLAETALWQAARQLLVLMDELSGQLLSPPADFETFRRQCAAAYGRRLGQPLEREARLVCELWHAMAQGERPGLLADYARRLAGAAEHATGPLYCLGLGRLTRLEERFLDQWAERQPVHALPMPAGFPGRRPFLEAAWSASPQDPALQARAVRLRQDLSASPFGDNLRLLAAKGLEEEARGAARAIHDWIAQGVEGIGIVALDRMTARRLRALLERDRVLIQDETGWTFSTAAVSHVIDRLAALTADDCYYQDLLDLFKSPFVFADLDNRSRLAWVAALEEAIRAAGTVQGWSRFAQLAGERAPDSLPLLRRLGEALGLLGVRRDTLAGWLRRLLRALDGLGATPAFQADAAGAQLLHLLRRLVDDVAPDDSIHAFGTWRGWLLQQLESATFVDSGIDSPLRLTSLDGARLRGFQAVLLLGADAARLPAAGPPGIFGEALRAELGLPGQRQIQEAQRRHLADILSQTPRVLVTWQARREGDPNPLSPWLELLEALHRLAYGEGLRRVDPPREPDMGSPADGTARPRPSLDRLPATLSASAWQSLVACPYQFFARHGLALRAPDEVAETAEKRDYGEQVHAILHAFHRDHPRLAAHDRRTLTERLQTLSRARFRPLLDQHYLALAWQARWLRQVPAYVDWALAREAAGYAWHAAEETRRVDLDLGAGRTLTLHGRLDRLDSVGDAPAVLDYKTQSADTLKRKLKPLGEDVQLPFYGLLSGAVEAAFVALDDKRPEAVPWPGELEEAARRETERITRAWTDLAEGATLAAQGAARTCQWCEMRGLCRKDYWPPEDAPG